MATSGALSDYSYLKDVLADFTYCSICQQIYNSPKQLRCQHSFCSNCLDEWKTTMNFSTSIRCPDCNQYTDLDEAGIKGLPNDFKTRSIIEGMTKPYLDQLHKRQADIASKLAEIDSFLGLDSVNPLHDILESIEERKNELIGMINTQADELIREAKDHWQHYQEGRNRLRLPAKAHREQLQAIKSNLDEVLKSPAQEVIEQRKELLDLTAPLLEADTFLQQYHHSPQLPHFEKSKTGINVGRLTKKTTVITPPTIPPRKSQQFPQKASFTLNPNLLVERALNGSFAFDPDGKLLILMEGGTGYLMGTDGKIHRAYESTTCTRPCSVAISQSRVAVLDGKEERLQLFMRGRNKISFQQVLAQSDKLMEAFAVEFLPNNTLIVCELTSFAVLGKDAQLLYRIDLVFNPSYISVDVDDSLFVSDRYRCLIHHYSLNRGGILESFVCRDEHGIEFKPFGIYIDKIAHRLLVCDRDRNRILQKQEDSFATWLDADFVGGGPCHAAFNQFGQLAVSLDTNKTLRFFTKKRD